MTRIFEIAARRSAKLDWLGTVWLASSVYAAAGMKSVRDGRSVSIRVDAGVSVRSWNRAVRKVSLA